jgi:hypothetical protein
MNDIDVAKGIMNSYQPAYSLKSDIEEWVHALPFRDAEHLLDSFKITLEDFYRAKTADSNPLLDYSCSWYPYYDAKSLVFSILFFDGDDGVALFTTDCEMFCEKGFKVSILAGWCDIPYDFMSEFIDILDEYEETIEIELEIWLEEEVLKKVEVSG